MTPEARLNAAAEVLDEIASTRAPAEAALRRWGQGHRFAGSRDRRAIADRVYRCLRARARLAWAMGREDGRALVLGSLALIDGLGLADIAASYSGQGYAPAPLTAEERARLAQTPGQPPAWVSAGLPEFVAADFRKVFGDHWAAEAEALMRPRAPIDLRINGLKFDAATALEELRRAELTPQPGEISAWALRLDSEPPPSIQKLEAFREGRIEVQDEGSQIAAWLAGATPGMTVVDYCGGGGGKTLALGQKLKGAGRLIACDIDPKRLSRIRPRLERSGVEADLRQLGPDGEGVEDLDGAADLVLVDAPCSGSGTWRRRPEDAWRLTEAEVERLHALQVAILHRAARLVRPGGRLAYVTCSMLSRENEGSADAFEASHTEFRRGSVVDSLTDDFTDAGRALIAGLATAHRLRLSPRRSGTDGFFVSLYERLR